MENYKQSVSNSRMPPQKVETRIISPKEGQMEITESNAASVTDTSNSVVSVCSKSPEEAEVPMCVDLPIPENRGVMPVNGTPDMADKYLNNQNGSIKSFIKEPLNLDSSVVTSSCAEQNADSQMEIADASTSNGPIKKILDTIEYDNNRSAPTSQNAKEQHANCSIKAKTCSQVGCPDVTCENEPNLNSHTERNSCTKNMSNSEFRHKELVYIIWFYCLVSCVLFTFYALREKVLRKILTNFLKALPYHHDIKRSSMALRHTFTSISIYPCARGSPIPMHSLPCDCCPRLRLNDRLRSFDWIHYIPPSLDIHNLASSGFYYCRYQHIIQCYYCGFVPEDCRTRHLFHFPHCQSHGTYNLDGGNTYAPVNGNGLNETENQEPPENDGRNYVTVQTHEIQNPSDSGEAQASRIAANLPRERRRGTSLNERDLAILLGLSTVDTQENNHQQGRQTSIVLPSNVSTSSMDHTTSSVDHTNNTAHPREVEGDYDIHRCIRSLTVGPQLQQEDARPGNRHICMICGEREARVVFLPCGHHVSCIECSTVVNACPEHRCQCHIQERITAASSR